MKHLICTVLTLSISLFTAAQEIAFQGEIAGMDSADISVIVMPLKQGEAPIFDKIQCTDGAFEAVVKCKLDMWHLVQLRSDEFNTVFGEEKSSSQKLKNRVIKFFIKPGDQLSIAGAIGEYGIDYQVYGNSINAQRNTFNEKLFPLEEEFNRLTILKGQSDQEQIKTRELDKQIVLINDKITATNLATIAQHPDWIYAAEELAAYPTDTISKYYPSFTPDVQQSFFGEHLFTILMAAETGSPAPEFTLQNEKGEEVSLSDFKGKYIVIEFWGTWCGYCVKGIPKMKTYYSKYHEQVEFIGIACKDNKQSWLNAIEEYNMEWTNLLAQGEKISDQYGVMGYPTKIIIDPEGRIKSKSTGENEEFYTVLDEMFGE